MSAPQLLDRYLADSERGNLTSVEIAASPAAAWEALQRTTLEECRVTGALLSLRGLPGRLLGRGAFSSERGSADGSSPTILGNMTRSRFVVLDEVAGEELVIGLVGQFWKLSGGSDVAIADGAAFLEFDEPGYVKTAANFRVEATPRGSRLTTETRSVTTDASARRKFAAYWMVVGLGSKWIRQDMLAAVRRRAEASESGAVT